MKVYCRNCVHCKYREFASLGVNWGWFCKLEDRIEIDAVGYKLTSFNSPLSDCTIKNKNNDCKQYKRKWWKFWLSQTEKNGV